MSETMLALIMTRAGGPEVMETREIARPRIANDTDILVRVMAAGVNPADWQNRRNGAVYGTGPRDAFTILGIDGTGIIEEVGSAITHLRPGDAVWYVDGGYAGNFGSYAEYKVLNGHYAARKPVSLGFVEAAALPTVALTAWEAVFEKADAKPGSFALVHGGAGGLGHITIQYLRRLGARIAATVSGDAKAAFVLSLGAELAIQYREEDVAAALRRWTGKAGADIVFDFVGHENFARSFDHAAPFGTLVNTVVSPWPKGSNDSAEWNNLDVRFVNIGQPQIAGDHLRRLRQTDVLRRVAGMVDRGELHPHVDRVVLFGGVGAAHEALENGRTMGRVVLSIAPDLAA
ncbi:alcohol dehydrogenase [Mesorhizobium sp. M7A.F.Ca.CA.001.07.2.1]|uniref:zinc-binding dehydrogenase n=4 Tax=Phyllobacteriaceae TaxID=69277 RepID=UPI000FCC5CA0|nr:MULTISPECIES: zinc-binding dehydrogenase [Mesorhizobium]RVB43648.1 alcohol dehydrogenase [Mesorhizobium sp. M7A.F.Ca.CA.004.05.1.1]MCF6126275.1 zinc-binding dehydrogenase [Mesorhizobium ciceri]MCQ8816287.1 zinc-binding dehydrogenase [Mesorhizobium sp. SEMIA396]RUX82367.1 alcohol dehydrogenase [Mesorhizobium sp. M7A.F.Ca.CA.004.08.2.1]RUX87892.1 alcohol dehydrogenase [Mesorhizobium sp. M7A.F.Ca.CA.004.08.1.1]